MPVPISLGQVGIRLAGRRRMDSVKRSHKLRIKFQRVGLDKRKRVIGLRLVVHADNLKARPTVPDASAASAAEQIEQPGLSSRRVITLWPMAISGGGTGFLLHRRCNYSARRRH